MLFDRGMGEGEVRVDICVKLWFEIWRWEKKIFNNRIPILTKFEALDGVESPPFAKSHLSISHN